MNHNSDIQQQVKNWQSIIRPLEGSSVSFEFFLFTSTRNQTDHFKLQESGFAICINNKIYAYRNHCPHIGSPLDWIPNQFFSEDGQTLTCHTHGAHFKPDTGDCISGPCPRGLYPLPIKLSDEPTTIMVPQDYYPEN
ncbi:MAG: Rieske 2Fe-2S domain-containing protein [Mariprofundaceae bacterium]